MSWENDPEDTGTISESAPLRVKVTDVMDGLLTNPRIVLEGLYVAYPPCVEICTFPERVVNVTESVL